MTKSIHGTGTAAVIGPVETKDKVGVEIQHSNTFFFFFACRLICLNQSHPAATELNYTSLASLSIHTPVYRAQGLDGNVIFHFSLK